MPLLSACVNCSASDLPAHLHPACLLRLRSPLHTAVISGVIAIILLEIGLNLGWVYLVMGIIIGSAVFPLAACITWKKCSAVAAVTSSLVRYCSFSFVCASVACLCCLALILTAPAACFVACHNILECERAPHSLPVSIQLPGILLYLISVLVSMYSQVGMPLAIMTWLVTAATLNDGVVDLQTTAQDYPMLAGNLVALFFSAIVCITLSFIFPQVRRCDLHLLVDTAACFLLGCKAQCVIV